MTALSSLSNRNLATLFVGTKQYSYHSINDLGEHVQRLPFSIKILLENLLRRYDGKTINATDIQSLANWQPTASKRDEISFMPARVLMQDFTGVPAVVDLAAMRDAMQVLGGNPELINPLQASELVIDHSVQVDTFGNADAANINAELEAKRNHERYNFLKWGQQAFDNFKVVPPDQGIIHQINLERLARVVFIDDDGLAYPDTLVGTDSHTTMINGLGVLGWGVGGIEAEAAMLGQAVSMLAPQVVGFELTGHLPEGATTTDLVLTIVEMLRAHGVVSKFVEFFGDGLAYLPLADRATIANMAPEYGATCGYFPIDEETLNFLFLSGRDEEQVALVRAYAKTQGLFRETGMNTATYSEYVSLDMGKIVPSIAGPKRPQDRIPLSQAASSLQENLSKLADEGIKSKGKAAIHINDQDLTINDGAVVIASITSCTNTSNPSVMLAAGLLAKKAAARGLKVKPWVKTSLAPGSQVVTRYLEHADLRQHLETLGFHVVGYGCATCIGNSGPLPTAVADAIADNNLSVCSVLSGNRNFEGRIHAATRLNYLASPPLVVAYALTGSMDIDWHEDAIANDNNGNPVYLRDIWPTRREVQQVVSSALGREQFLAAYKDVFAGDHRWQALEAPTGKLYAWDNDSTYVQNPPYFQGMQAKAADIKPIANARVLAKLGDSVTT
ncbi:MAG: aconitate hydratase AcnA, partial [Mariprofundales bacterium]